MANRRSMWRHLLLMVEARRVRCLLTRDKMTQLVAVVLWVERNMFTRSM